MLCPRGGRRPLPGVEPGDVARRSDVHVPGAQVPVDLRGDGLHLGIFFDSRRSHSTMFRKCMLPPTLSSIVRSSSTPRSSNNLASTRWVIVAPT